MAATSQLNIVTKVSFDSIIILISFNKKTNKAAEANTE